MTQGNEHDPVREETGELLDELESALLELEETPDSTDALNAAFRAVHTIKGIADMVGLHDILKLTHEMETVFDLVRSGIAYGSHDLAELGLKTKDHIRTMLDAPSEADAETTGKLTRAFRDYADTIRAGGTPVADAEAVCVSDESESTPSSDAGTGGEPAAAKAGKTWRITFKPHESACLTQNPLAFIEEVSRLGRTEVYPDLRELPSLEEMDPEVCAAEWVMLLTADIDVNEIYDAAMFYEEAGEIAVSEVDDAQQVRAEFAERSEEFALFAAPGEVQDASDLKAEAAAQQSVPCAPSAVSVASAQKVKEDVKASTAARVQSKTLSGIRVDAAKLDDLVSLVGELVVAQSRLNLIASRLHDPALTGVVEEMELLNDSLRDRTMSMRMLPIGTTFDRFRRLVRDLSFEMGKNIKLETRGADTELDKTVIEQLGDPLVHLLRNSIDHGIEPPDDRERLGKPRTGVITLSAEHSAGNVLIRIADDGRGLDRDKVAAKGVEKGIIKDPAMYTDKEIFNLIFHPGFSTADKVTNVSGRGVGMDVVKKSVEALRGNLDLTGEPGKGTTVTISLPLTLAIIEGLQIRCGDEFFIVPLSAVEECVELTETDRDDKGKRIINLRGGIVPYVRLREWFEIPGRCPEIEQVIITSVEDKLTGIAVDEVIGRQQTVIKNLSRVYRHVQEISGAAIKDDGTMALILDVEMLINKAESELSRREPAPSDEL